MPEIMVLSCPVCGAPLNAESEKCSFCGSYIFIKTDLPKLDRRALNQSVIQDHIADFRKRVRADTYDEEAHYGLGLAYFSLGLLSDSIDELTQAARLMPENPNIQAQLAVALHDSFMSGNASAESQMNSRIQTALLLDPNHVEATVLKAEVLIDSNQFSEAISAIQNLDSSDRSRVESKLVTELEKLGHHNLSTKNWDGAQQCWQTLSPIDDGAAKRLATEFLSINSDLLPKKHKPPVSGRHTNQTNSGPKRFFVTVLVTFGTVVGALIGLIVLALLVAPENGEPFGTGATVAFLIAFLAGIVAIVAAPIWYWRRSRPGRAVETDSLQSYRRDTRPGSLYGANSDSKELYKVASELLEKVKTRQKLWDTEAAYRASSTRK